MPKKEISLKVDQQSKHMQAAFWMLTMIYVCCFGLHRKNLRSLWKVSGRVFHSVLHDVNVSNMFKKYVAR